MVKLVLKDNYAVYISERTGIEYISYIDLFKHSEIEEAMENQKVTSTNKLDFGGMLGLRTLAGYENRYLINRLFLLIKEDYYRRVRDIPRISIILNIRRTITDEELEKQVAQQGLELLSVEDNPGEMRLF